MKLVANNDTNIRSANIDQQKPATLNWISQNGLLSELSQNFQKVIFNESKFLFNTLVFDTKYEHHRTQNNNLFYLFNN